MQSLVEGCPVMCQLLKEELMKKKLKIKFKLLRSYVLFRRLQKFTYT
jgi:hypothetical protein